MARRDMNVPHSSFDADKNECLFHHLDTAKKKCSTQTPEGLHSAGSFRTLKIQASCSNAVVK